MKITYAVSWLKGTTQRWYEPNLSLRDRDLPGFAHYWEEFEEVLKTTFREPNPVASASYKLDSLIMKDNHHINKYNVDFQELATITRYDNRTLHAMYYRSLTPHIKDALAISGKPDTLIMLKTKAQAMDLHYWERREEERLKSSLSASSSSKPAASSSSLTSQSTSKTNMNTSSSHSRSTTPADASKPKGPDLSKILGPDGKLLPTEKECWRKNNLCLICASKDHHAEKCPSHCESTQARTATIEELDSLSEADASDSPN